MDLRDWLIGELDDVTGRLRAQLLDAVPPERRLERADGTGNCTGCSAPSRWRG